jgi:hypothetical protein
MPEDFQGKNGLDEDLREFYLLLERYEKEKIPEIKWALENQQEDIFFSVKHRTLEYHITDDVARGINSYLAGLLKEVFDDSF